MRDTGVGIESVRLQDLFTAFTKIQRYRELNSEGCGLGLTICKKIAIAMGGDVTVQSIVGTGSVFSVILPSRKRSTVVSDSPIPIAIHNDRFESSRAAEKNKLLLQAITSSYEEFEDQEVRRVSAYSLSKPRNILKAPVKSRKLIHLSENLAAQVRSRETKHIDTTPLQTPKVLVVDDDPFNVAGVLGLLEALKITDVLSAYDGQ